MPATRHRGTSPPCRLGTTRLFLSIAPMVAAALWLGCGEPTTVPSQDHAAALSISPDSILLLERETIHLVPAVIDSSGAVLEDRVITWFSSDPKVAAVSSAGVVTALSMGRVWIHAIVGTAADSALVDVRIVFRTISAGGNHTCGVTAAQSAYCWGKGSLGRLGNGTIESRLTPARVAGDVHFSSVSAGDGFSCGLSRGAAYCWGNNGSTQLGSGDKDQAWVPERVAGGLAFTLVAVNTFHTCGIVGEDGLGYCWGADWAGQIGDGSQAPGLAPRAVAGGLRFQSLDTGFLFTCGLATDGQAFCWGNNELGQLGRTELDETCIGMNGRVVTCSTVPSPVLGGVAFRVVTTGTAHACALTPEGRAYCWGDNASGQLGNGSTAQAATPIQVAGGITFASISAGDRHTCGVDINGAAYCWGHNGHGALGTTATFESCGGKLCSTTPIPVSGDFRFRAVNAATGPGGSHTCGITRANRAYCWGRNDAGQLGAAYRGGLTFDPLLVHGQAASPGR